MRDQNCAKSVALAAVIGRDSLDRAQGWWPMRHQLRAMDAVIAVIALVACNPSGGGPPEGPKQIVVFSQRTLVMDRLNVPVAPPITVGSVLQGDALESEAPEVVGV